MKKYKKLKEGSKKEEALDKFEKSGKSKKFGAPKVAKKGMKGPALLKQAMGKYAKK